MRVQEIMSTDVKTVSRSVTVASARGLMRLGGIHHLLVVEEGRVVGVVSDLDLGGPVATRRGDGGATPIADVMSEHVVTAPADATVRQAANLLRGHGIGCLAIVADEKPVGIVTISDLLELIGRGVERPIERSTRWTLRRRGARDAGPGTRHARRI